MEKIKNNKKVIIIVAAVLLVLAIVIGVLRTINKNPVKADAKSKGYVVQHSMSIEGSPQGDIGGVEIDYILPNSPYYEGITSYTLETEKEAADYYKMLQGSLVETLTDTLKSKKETDHSYLYDAGDFYYMGSYKGKTVLIATVDNSEGFKDNYKNLRKGFESLGYDLPE